MKFFYFFLAIDLVISFIYSTLINSFSNFAFINCSFIVGMVYLLFGALCFVWEKGFFDITIFSFNKISQQMQKRQSVDLVEEDIAIEDYVYRKNHFAFTYHLLLSGFIISTTCIILSFIAIS